MTRTKTRQRPAPRRARTSPREVRMPVPGHARGKDAYLVIRRRGSRWAVLDSFRGAPAYVGAAELWQELAKAESDGEVYRWSEADARRLMARFVEQAVEIHLNMLGRLRRIESLAADMAPPEVMPQVLTPEQVRERLRQAEAEVAAARTKRAEPVEERVFNVPAALDRPDWQPPRPDPAPDPRLLSLKAMGIPANCEDATVGLPLLRVHGPDVTAVLPVVAQWPPLPDKPPTVHLKHLTESAPSAGEDARASVADALAPDLVH
jgi:hypothetical protein